MAGLPPYPEQQLLLDATFALDRKNPDVPAAFSAAAVVARQQLKTGWLKQLCLGWMFVLPQPLIVWTSHEYSTTEESFGDLVAAIAQHPDLDRRVKRVRTGSGSQAIELLNGSRVRFKARTAGGGRGLTGSKVILDEAFALEPSMMGALLPTMIKNPQGQVVYASSAGMAKSRVLRGVRDRGRAGAKRAVYAEWLAARRECADRGCDHQVGTPGCALDDIALWRKACIITAREDWAAMAAIANLRRELPPEEFMRECLGWWDEPMGDAAILESTWSPMLDPRSSTVAPVFALDVSPDRAWSSIVVAGPNGHGKIHVEITGNDTEFDYRRGTSWVRFRCRDMLARRGELTLHILAGSAAESLVPDLEEDGVVVERISNADMVAACGRFYDLATEGRLAHLGQDELTTSVTSARKKQVGERAFTWVRPAELTNISVMYAATAAAWKASASLYDPLANIF